MAKRYKINTDNVKYVLAQNQEKIAIVAFATILFGATIFAIRMAKNEKHKSINIIAKDGELTVQEGEFIGIIEFRDYDIINKTNDSLEISVHTKDPEKRYVFSEYIVDNINIIETKDGSYIVQFDEKNISEKGYKKFAESFVSSQVSEGRQRTRS